MTAVVVVAVSIGNTLAVSSVGYATATD